MTTSEPARPPLCRPRLLPDEWLETYLFRVARANGIRRPRLSDIERFRPTLPVTALSKPDGYPVWSNAALPRWSVVTRANKIRYCPQCMIESRHIRSRWRLSLFDVCTLHHIRLKDDLAEPVMTRDYKQEGRYFVTDVTDEQLWDGAVCPMPSERQHVDRLWSGFEKSVVGDSLSSAFRQLTHILFLEAMLDALAAVTSESESLTIGAPRPTRLAEMVEKHRFTLSPDASGIWDFLDQITDSAHRKAALARLRRMLLDEAQRPTCFSSLPVADLRTHLLKDGQRQLSPQTVGELHPGHGVPNGYVSFEKAASLIGCSRHLLRHFVRENTRTVEHGRQRYQYLPFIAVEACRRWFASIASRDQMAKELHIDQRACVTLLKSGLLQPLIINGQTYFYRTHFAGLSRQLDDLSQPCPASSEHLQPLFGTWLPWSGRYISSSHDVLREILQGKFAVFRRLGNPGLTAYFVDWSVIERLHQSRVGAAATRKRQEQAARQLSLLPE